MKKGDILYGEYPFIVRFILTLIIFKVLRDKNSPLIIPVIFLLILDYFDFPCPAISNRIDTKGTFYIYRADINYQLRDKVLDLFAYYYLIFLYKNIFDTKTMFVLQILLIWRTIGVLIFLKIKSNKDIWLFFDGINAVLILYSLKRYSSFLEKNYDVLLWFAIIFKIFYEPIHHNKSYV